VASYCGVVMARDNRPLGALSGIRLVVILLVALAGWFLRPHDSSPPRAVPHPAPDSAPAPAPPTTDRYDLEADEARGGHTLARHVGQTDAQLRARLANDSGISTASSYATQALAERTVARALRENADRVRNWSARSGNRPNLAIDYHGPPDEILGRSIHRGSPPVECTDAVIVLRWSGRSYYVLTTYPEASR
jgi:hypothetical protein